MLKNSMLTLGRDWLPSLAVSRNRYLVAVSFPEYLFRISLLEQLWHPRFGLGWAVFALEVWAEKFSAV
jgi:hypothetical protein